MVNAVFNSNGTIGLSSTLNMKCATVRMCGTYIILKYLQNGRINNTITQYREVLDHLTRQGW